MSGFDLKQFILSGLRSAVVSNVPVDKLRQTVRTWSNKGVLTDADLETVPGLKEKIAKVT